MSKQKVTGAHHKKRYGQHKKHSHSYRKVYWPYIPMLLMLFVVLVVGISPAHVGKVLGQHTNIDSQSLLIETNNERSERGLGQLIANQQLTAAAQLKAQDMVARNYWSHRTPDGQDPWVFINDVSYVYQRAGENLAYGFRSSESTVLGWMQSQSHRENMLDPNYQEVGFGIAEAKDYLGNGEATIVVAFYAAPKTAAAVAAETSPNGGSNFVLPQLTKPVNVASIHISQAALTSLIIGFITGGAAMFLIGRHSLRLKRAIVNGEHFIMHHPMVDLSATILIVAGAFLLQSAGVIG